MGRRNLVFVSFAVHKPASWQWMSAFCSPALSELELQQQKLQEGSKVSSFCGPDTESHAHLDCISVPPQKIQDLHSNGIVWHKHQSSATVSSVRNHLFRLNSSDWTLGTMQRNGFVNVRHVFTYLLAQGPTVKCRGGTLFCNNTSQWTLSDPFWRAFLLELFSLAAWFEVKKRKIHPAVVLKLQGSIKSPWSTRGTALCGLYSIQRRTSLWCPPSLTEAKGNI